MTYLLDTNVFLWACAGRRELSPKARRICESPSASRVVSVASLWEIITKCSIGKLSVRNPTEALPVWVAELNARVLPLETSHAYAAYALPLVHRDPFDRMLIAQAVAEGFTIVTRDERIHSYPVQWIW